MQNFTIAEWQTVNVAIDPEGPLVSVESIVGERINAKVNGAGTEAAARVSDLLAVVNAGQDAGLVSEGAATLARVALDDIAFIDMRPLGVHIVSAYVVTHAAAYAATRQTRTPGSNVPCAVLDALVGHALDDLVEFLYSAASWGFAIARAYSEDDIASHDRDQKRAIQHIDSATSRMAKIIADSQAGEPVGPSDTLARPMCWKCARWHDTPAQAASCNCGGIGGY